MKSSNGLWAILIGGSICCLADTGFAQSAPNTAVEGLVVNSKGTPLPGVEVSLWVEGEVAPIVSAKTDKTGKYSLKVKNDIVFTIWYSHTKMTSAVLTYLSGQNHQNINKVLYLKGDPSSLAIYSYLESLDRAVYVMSITPSEQREMLFMSMKKLGIWPDAGIKSISLKGVQESALKFYKAKISSLTTHTAALGIRNP